MSVSLKDDRANLTIQGDEITITGSPEGRLTVSHGDPQATAHIGVATDAHDASAISFTPTGSLVATDVQAAIAEAASEAYQLSGHTLSAHDTLGLATQTELDTHAALQGLSSHIPTAGVTDAHVAAGAAIAYSKLALTGSVVVGDLAFDPATQAELDAEAATRAAADATFALQADAVMDGDTAGGVLSGTYPNPGFAVDMATQAELDAHEAAGDPHPGYLTTAEGNAAYELAGTVATHEADTTSVHGITDTADLIRRAGALTAGSILFASGGNTAQQDNANLFWDDTNNILRIGGAATPLTAAVQLSNSVSRQGLMVKTTTGSDVWAVIAEGAGALGNRANLGGLTKALRVVPTATSIGIEVQGAASQTGNLTQWQDSTGAAISVVDANQKFGVGKSSSLGARLHVQSGSATEITQILQGAASQSANLTEWRDSAGAMMAQVTSAGKFQTISGSAASPGYSFSGNPTMGMYRAASGVVGFSVNSTEAIRLDTSGLTVQLGLKWGAAALEQTTVGAAGAAQILPAMPTKYLKVIDSAGTTLVIPAYAAA